MHIKQLLRRMNASTIIATTALFVTLGGTSYAAMTVGTHQIRRGAVTTPKLHMHAVTTQKLARNAVRSKTLANRTVTSAKLSKGAVKPVNIANGAITITKFAPSVRPAWAAVAAGATTFAAGGSHGFATLTHPATGIYCLTPKPGYAAGHIAVASPDTGSSTGLPSLLGFEVGVAQGAPDCSPGDVEVQTFALVSVVSGLLKSDGIGFTVVAG
jgi:hypothetical protein